LNKEATLSQVGRWNGSIWEWNLEWRRIWFQWEEYLVSQNFLELDNNLLNSQSCDEWIWKANNFQVCTVKSIYNILNEWVLGEDKTLYKTFWKIKAFLPLQCWLREFYLIRYLPSITYIVEVRSWVICYAHCAKRRRKVLVIFFYRVVLLGECGIYIIHGLESVQHHIS